MTYRLIPNRSTGTSAANAAQSVSTPTGKNRRRILYVIVAYSNTPTQSGVTIELDSGAGTAFDALIETGGANARYTFWQPTGDLVLLADDALKVTAPAGGGGLTSSIAIVSEDAD